MQDLDLSHEQDAEFAEQGELIEIDLSDGGVEGVSELVSELEETAGSFRVGGFKCAKCNLAHGHDTDKHRASDTFTLTHEEAGGMEFNPNCHCGAHELAARGRQYGVNESSAQSTADGAPVPPRVQRQLRTSA